MNKPKEQYFSEYQNFSSQLNTQNFRIFITYRFYFPITFVQAVAPSEGCDPSDAVILVREFLKRHIHETENEYLDFQCLGPSPFWANFILQSKDGRDLNPTRKGFEVEQIRQRGYDYFKFTLDLAPLGSWFKSY